MLVEKDERRGKGGMDERESGETKRGGAQKSKKGRETKGEEEGENMCGVCECARARLRYRAGGR